MYYVLESWRTLMFLMNLEMVSKDRDYPSEPSVKVSSRSIVRNCVKTPPILQVTSWSLGGHGGSWWTWRWCQRKGTIHLNFHPSYLFLESWRTLMFLMDLKMKGEKIPLPALIKKSIVEYISDIINLLISTNKGVTLLIFWSSFPSNLRHMHQQQTASS